MRFACIHLVFGAIAFAAVLDRVAVVVGKDVITEGELLEELRLEDFTASRPLDLSPAARRAAADRLIDQQLIRQDMEIAHYKAPDPKEAEAMVRNFRNQHFRAEQEFRAALNRYGLTEEELKQYFLWQLTVIRFTDERFRPNLLRPAESSVSRLAESPNAPAVPPPHNRVPPPGPTPETQSADRLAPSALPAAPGGNVDQQLDAWLKQARSTTRISFKPEAFQ